MAHRQGEKDATRFRSKRLYSADGKYYFSTREGFEVGPYGTQEEAEKGLERFIETILKTESIQAAKSAALHGAWAMTNFY